MLSLYPRWPALLVLAAACGGGDPGAIDAPGGDPKIDAPPNRCQPIPATGQFNKRQGNPRLLPKQTFGDGKIDLSIADPDVRWDGALYQLYYGATHATSFNDPEKVQVIRHATSPDKVTWTVDDQPVLTASPDTAAWDHTHTEKPTVAFNPNAPPDRRYLMLYSGASGTFPGRTFPAYAIGAAFSADGVSFTRVPAAESPFGKAGLVLTGKAAYPAAVEAMVADPEVVFVDGTYHLWFSSFACEGAGCATVSDFGIAYATSTDGVQWTVRAAPVKSLLRASANDTTGGQQPSVIYDAEHCRWEMWLTNDAPGETNAQPVAFNNTAGVWHADSTDGVVWNIFYTGARNLTWNATTPDAGEALGLLTGADVAQNSTGRLMLYVGFDDKNVPPGFSLPDRTPQGSRPGVMTLNIATRDLP
ncbi:MAG: hypothetical protein KIT31_07670 [Deltaproteobacteria bacterium]|nr:hypothetical protein [Deltaproteobacteria bacterium]